MKNVVIICLLQLPLLGCFSQKKNTYPNYNRFKSIFEKSFTSHFPDNLEVITDPKSTYSFSARTDTIIHEVCFMLYEYEVSDSYMKQTAEKIKGKTIAQYKVTDRCLLVVNRFDTPETYEKNKEGKINDSTLINLPCYENLYPIPHFLDYKYLASQGPVWLNRDFTIYVLEAKSVNPYKEFAMSPDKQMPAKWKNGYSKGVAISKKDNTVIHWSVMW